MNRSIYYLSPALFLLSSCATLNDSMTLGAGMGAAVGGLSTYTAQASSGGPVPAENVALGAGLGLGIGLITSYFTHQSVAASRDSRAESNIDMHFGDLPPSPFLVPKTLPKKGRR